MIALFCEGMRQRGHHIDLFAGPGSHSYGGRTWIHSAPSRWWPDRAVRKIWFQLISLLAARNADVVMNFARLDYLWALLKTRMPIVCRFANPVPQSEIDWVLARRQERVHFLGISYSQVAKLEPRELITVIHNPVDTARFRFDEESHNPPYVAFLGRITSNKGADTAIEIARRAGVRLKLAGNVSNEPGGKEFFETKIRPHLSDDAEYVGPLDDPAKQEFLGGAQALLFPIRWTEPFGIVMIESLACGTPVVATRCASTPEVICHEKTGFLCDSMDELVDGVGRSRQLSRRACRAEAEQRFSIDVITSQHESLLRDLISAT